MSHSPFGIFSGAWGWSTQELQTSSPKPPCLAKYCHHQSKNRTLQKLPSTLLPLLLLIWTQLDVPSHHLEHRENWYLLVITTSVEQLSLGPGSDNPERSTTDSTRGNTFQNPWMAAIFSGSTRAVSYGGNTVKELKEQDGKWTPSKK